MLVLTVNVGQAVQIGQDTFVRVDNKRAESVRLVFATKVHPIRVIKDGAFPERFSRGITGLPRAI